MSDTLKITPLGAAIVEAMPNKRKMRRIQRAFDREWKCPTSNIFTAEQVVEFYRERGAVVEPYSPGRT